MTRPLPLAIDTLGGDFGLRVTLPASLQVLQELPDLHLCLVGDADAMRRQAAASNISSDRLSFVHAPENIPMDEPLPAILRRDGTCSMHAALGLLAEGKVNGLVSAGHTAGLMVLGRAHVDMLHGFSRPAFCTALPGRRDDCYLLDLGANVECGSSQLCEFAAMGAGLVSALHEAPLPTVALLSNGSEVGKGTDAIREAASVLEEAPGIQFIGYIEANELLESPAQVIVCDGFAGNVALKAMEGTASFAALKLREIYTGNVYSRLLGWLSRARLASLAEHMNPERYGGAFLLGLDGVVVKSHGGSGVDGFAAAIRQAALCVEHDMVPRMAQSFETGVRETL